VRSAAFALVAGLALVGLGIGLVAATILGKLV